MTETKLSKFRRWREYRALTQAQIAEATETTQQYVSSVDLGTRPSAEFLAKLKLAFGVSPDELGFELTWEPAVKEKT